MKCTFVRTRTHYGSWQKRFPDIMLRYCLWTHLTSLPKLATFDATPPYIANRVPLQSKHPLPSTKLWALPFPRAWPFQGRDVARQPNSSGMITTLSWVWLHLFFLFRPLLRLLSLACKQQKPYSDHFPSVNIPLSSFFIAQTFQPCPSRLINSGWRTRLHRVHFTQKLPWRD